MEEILASIRRIISDDDTPDTNVADPRRSSGSAANVSHKFSSAEVLGTISHGAEHVVLIHSEPPPTDDIGGEEFGEFVRRICDGITEQMLATPEDHLAHLKARLA